MATATNSVEPWNIASRAGIRNVTLERLPDPSNFIRLLQVQLLSEKELACEYVTCSLDSPLRYTAISYTWGDPTPIRDITISGRSIKVHENCYYALWQARHAYLLSTPFYWIDALCIDQTNLEEKSVQVQAMHRVFGQAERVAVSLGPVTADSGIMAKELRLLDRLAKDLEQAHPELKVEARMLDGGERTEREFYLGRALDSLSAERLRAFAGSYRSFANRPYWSRLWIVQELSAAKQIDLLHGKLKYEWDWFRGFSRYLEQKPSLGLDGSTPMRVAVPFIINPSVTSTVSSLHRYVWPIAPTLEIYAGFHCSDPRDHIYALLSTIDTPNDGAPLTVDYRKSALKLAQDTLHCFGGSSSSPVDVRDLIRCTTAVMSALQLTTPLGDVLTFFNDAVNRRRHSLASRPSSIPRGGAPPSCDAGYQLCVKLPEDARSWCSIAKDGPPDGKLTLSGCFLEDWEEPDRVWTLPTTTLRRAEPAENLYLGDNLVGITCPSTASGDLVVTIDFCSRTESLLGLVLAECGKKAYAIRGYVYLHPALSFCRGREYTLCGGQCLGSHQQKDDEVLIHFDVEDWMVLMSHLVVPSISIPENILTTGVTRSATSSRAIMKALPPAPKQHETEGQSEGWGFLRSIETTTHVEQIIG